MSYTVTNPADDGSIGTLRYGLEQGEPSIMIDSDLVPTINVLSPLIVTVPTVIDTTWTTTLVGANSVTIAAYMFEASAPLTIRNVLLTSPVEGNCGFMITTDGNLTMEYCYMENLGSPDVSRGTCINVIADAESTREITLRECTFRNNESGFGGAVLWCMLEYFSNFILTMVNVLDDNNNGNVESGGSVYITQSAYPEPRTMTISMDGCSIMGNSGPTYGGYLFEPMNSTALTLTINEGAFTNALLEINSWGEDFGSPLPDSSLINVAVTKTSFSFDRMIFNCTNVSGTVETNIGLIDTFFTNGAYFSASTSAVFDGTVDVDIDRCLFIEASPRALTLESLVDGSVLTSSIQNSTFTSVPGIGLHVGATNLGQATVIGRNLTISDNNVGIQLETASGGIGNITLYNSIIAGNVSDYVEDDTAGVPSYTTVSCITDTTNLNLQPLAYNGGYTPTMAIDQISTAFNTGDNSFVLTATDQRGFPRIAYGTVDIGAYEFQEPFVVCLRGDAKVLVNGQYIPIESVKAGDSVFDCHSKRYVPVLHNIVTEKARKFALIEEGSVATHIPHEDLYITEGHIVNINGKHVKAKDVPGVEIVHCEPQIVYSIVTKNAIFIDINGLPVYTWSAEKWENKSQNHKAWKAQ